MKSFKFYAKFTMSNAMNDKYELVQDLRVVMYSMFLLGGAPLIRQTWYQARGFKSVLGSKKLHISTSSIVLYSLVHHSHTVP